MLASDNVAGAHPLVIESLVRANAGHSLAYGNDDHTRRAEQMFSEVFGRDVRTLFVYGGTGANVLALASVLQQAECVVCTNWSHIHMDETGAPERVLGAKLLDLPCADAKLTPDQVRAAAAARATRTTRNPALCHSRNPPNSARSTPPPRCARSATLHTSTACSCTWMPRESATPPPRSAQPRCAAGLHRRRGCRRAVVRRYQGGCRLR